MTSATPMVEAATFRPDPEMFVCMDKTGCYHVSWYEADHKALMAKFGTEHEARYVRTPAPSTPVAEGIVGPRTLDEWQESDGDVVWWCWQDDQWLGEPAYIGSPLDLGRGYELLIADQKFVVNLDDWPGYHTHWTPHPTFPASLKGDPTP